MGSLANSMTARPQFSTRSLGDESVGGAERWIMDDRFEESHVPHRQKRRADDNLEGEQRLSKRFNLLNLEHHDKLYIPVEGHAPPNHSITTAPNDSMQLDDTKDKVYIHNLAAEIADIESNENTPLFLPDIEQKLSKIPRSVLSGRDPPISNNQMVLYNVPSSLSIPEEQDSVRRAIIESRARARETQALERKAAQKDLMEKDLLGNLTKHDASRNGIATGKELDPDEDAMDIE
ncbi:MAG: hypothetical protein LQ344_004361 [Seirophora lacunosa]|nr:MAG: hypothetical protein LQ344_004361 [Seirophora lacunosa]